MSLMQLLKWLLSGGVVEYGLTWAEYHINPINQSVNQSIDQSINQLINQTSQSVNQPIKVLCNVWSG